MTTYSKEDHLRMARKHLEQGLSKDIGDREMENELIQMRNRIGVIRSELVGKEKQ